MARSRSPQTFTVYWTQDRTDYFVSRVATGYWLQLLFGGPHNRMPPFNRVRPGDWLYLAGVRDRVLHVFGRMRVLGKMPLLDYARANPAEFPGHDQQSIHRLMDVWQAADPDIDALIWSCTDDVLIGADGTTASASLAGGGQLHPYPGRQGGAEAADRERRN